ncbi:MAG: penicillin-binding transpeptidase domain-containing protein, partial [Bilophila sp.]
MAYLGSQHKRKIRQNQSLPNRKKKGGGLGAWFAGINWSSFRFHTVAVIFCFVWGSLWVRAGYIQLWDGPYLAEKARRQHMSAETVSMPRGMITDRNGHILARSVECRSVYANPSQIGDVEATTNTLAGLLGLKVSELRPELEKTRGFVWIKRRLDDAMAESVRLAALPGIDGKGLEGIERSFDSELSGLSMRQVVQRDASGRQFDVVNENDTPVARDVRLTLDLQVQAIAEEELSSIVEEVDAKWGGVLVADVKSGDVLAWAQYPFFNPNSYRQYAPGEYRNRLAQDALEPGSSFKPFLLAAALQEGLVSRDTSFDCEGGLWRTRTITVRDDGRHYKNLTVAQILSLSSNIGCGKIGLQLGAVRYQRYLSRLGFGERTGLQLSESKGILRAPKEWSE